MQPERPVLYAALICERVLLDEDGINTLFRLVDTVDFRLPSSFPVGMQEESDVSNVRLSLQITLFTRWGGPDGEYTERVTIIDIHDEERDLEQEIKFALRGGRRFQQIRHYINMEIRPESGVRRFRIYLNDQPYIDVPLQVNVEAG